MIERENGPASEPSSERLESSAESDDSHALAKKFTPPPGTVPRGGFAVSDKSERDGWTLIALVPDIGREPSAASSEEMARSVWCAVSAPWHPALLTAAAALPRVESLDSPSPPRAREIRIVAGSPRDRLPSGYRTGADDAGATVIEAGTDRDELVRRLVAKVNGPGAAGEKIDSIARDFLALGTIHFMLRELTVAMGHADSVDHDGLAAEMMAAAHCWDQTDTAGAINRVRAAFESLSRARERFYPVDAYLIDICLLDRSMASGVLGPALETPVPITFVATAEAISIQAERDPDAMSSLRQAIADGWADIAGGSWDEAEEPLLPLESILWQLKKGAESYRAHLDDRTVETFARRRFGLYTQLPQIAKRFGFRYAVHLGLDAGRFPVYPETKRLWESPDGSYLESLIRPPLAADKAAAGWNLPWRMAATMKNDHVATVPLVHWPLPVAPWYLDLRRMAAHSPVLGRLTTLNDYFHLTDRPYETFRPDPDAYASPYLNQAIARRDRAPISGLSRRHRLRGSLDALGTVAAFDRAIAATGVGAPTTTAEPSRLEPIEELVETGQYDVAATALTAAGPQMAADLAERILSVSAGSSPAVDSTRPGYLILNPLSMPRRAPVTLPGAPLDLRPEGALRAAQFTDEGVVAVVDLPGFGFAWVAGNTDPERPLSSSSGLSVRDRRLCHESIEVEIDGATGGIRSIVAPGEPSARMGQQLVIAGLVDAEGKPATSRMRIDKFEVEFGGPALLQAVSTGGLVDPRDERRLASFRQRFRLWAGRPVLELDITIADLDQAWLETAATSDPWSAYLACRWAWPDATAMVRRGVLLSSEITEADRPEMPDFLELSTRNQRTALLFGGLAHHRKHGARMLDTLLIAGREQCRSFSLGIVLEQERLARLAQEWITPALVVPTPSGPPPMGSTGWLAQVDHKAVVVTRVEFVAETSDGGGWGLIVHLLESSGLAARTKLRLFRNPTRARQVDFLGETIIELSLDGDAVRIDLTPHELARIEVTVG
jgi:alpha-mannosidase